MKIDRRPKLAPPNLHNAMMLLVCAVGLGGGLTVGTLVSPNFSTFGTIRQFLVPAVCVTPLVFWGFHCLSKEPIKTGAAYFLFFIYLVALIGLMVFWFLYFTSDF